jgi:macrolide transport system ATP-binding/permease protein
MIEVLRSLRRLLASLRPGSFDGDADEEMASHLAFAIGENVRRGMTEREARRQALIAFGGVDQAKERRRDAGRLAFLDVLFQDVRYAIRQLRKNRGFALTAIVVLALGIATAVAIFAFVDAALLKPLPYSNPTRLVHVTETVRMIGRANLSVADYLDWKASNTVFSSLDVFDGQGYLLRAPDGPRPVRGVRVSDGFFRTLGVFPVLGRDFRPGEDQPEAAPTALLSYSAWRSRFGGRRGAVGETVLLSGAPYTVIGVLPPEFQFAPTPQAEFWTTLHPSRDPTSCDARRSCHGLEGVARLKDGVSIETARVEIETIARRLEREYPDSNRDQGASVLSLSDVIVGDVRPVLLLLLAGAGLLLSIACVNVSNLLLVRSESRRREIAVRGALGASTARLTRQFVTEAVVLVSASGLLGLAGARATMRLLTALIPKTLLGGMPYLAGLGLNWRVLAFASLVLLLAATLCSVAPVVRLPRLGIREGLSESGGRTAGTVWRRLGAHLVTVELALAVVLLVGASLLGKSVYLLLRVELNFAADHLATVQVVAPGSAYAKDEQVVRLGRDILRRLAALPGVQSAAVAGLLPLSGNGNTTWIRIEGHAYAGEHNEVNERQASADYFQTLRAKLVRGRWFRDDEDASKPPVAIINRALARKYFGGEDPIGKRMGDTDLSPKSITEIVGIVDDIREGSLDSEIVPAVYYPFNQQPTNFFAVVVRTSQAEESALATVVATVRATASDVGTAGEQTMAARATESPTAYLRRSSAWLAGGFALAALLLAVVGLYGVVAYSVRQRTREIGVRMALGAPRASVYQLVLQEAGLLIAVGLVFGLVGSVAAASMMRSLLFNVSAWDASALAGVAVVLAASTLLATYLPARRAVSINPVEALRSE